MLNFIYLHVQGYQTGTQVWESMLKHSFGDEDDEDGVFEQCMIDI